MNLGTHQRFRARAQRKTPSSEENYHPEKQLIKSFIQTADTHLELLKLSTILYFESLSCSCVINNVVNPSGIELIKQPWFLLVMRDSQTEGSSANYMI